MNTQRSIPLAHVLVLLLCASLSTSAQTAATPAQLARIDQIARFYVDHQQFMGTVLVAQGDKIVFDKAYGLASEEWQTPNTTDTKFRLGSITKQFTATAILLLEERGKLKTDDLIKQYMPDAPAAWDKITIFHLLTHTSGVPNFTDFPDYDKFQLGPVMPGQLVAHFRDKPLDFEPGTQWKYSNSGYEVLGWLIEKVSGQNYADFLEQNIFKPLAMNDSGYDSNAAIMPHRASGYTNAKGKLQNAGYVDMSVPYSAGSLYSTTHDLLRWEQGLFGGKVLSAASLKKMMTPFKNGYAMGVGVRTANGRTEISHGGGINGFNTYLAYFPDEKLTLVALSNINGIAPNTIAADAARVLHGETITLPSERKEIAVKPDVLPQYAGIYELTPNASLVLTLEGTRLMAQIAGQKKDPLYAEAPDKFFLKDVDAQVEFVRDAQGNINGAVLHQGGRDIKAAKK